MGTFFNFFLKTLAFFFATTFFIILIAFTLIIFQKDKITKKKFEFFEGNINSKNKIALLNLKGPIFNEPSNFIEFGIIDNLDAIYVSEIEKDLEELKSEKIKGVILSIDSPGGSVSATYNLYNALQKFKKNNNIIIFSHTNEILASGGYWAVLSSDKIFADYGALIGSIGVRGPDWIYYDNPISISTGIFGQSIETTDGIKKFNTIAGRSKDIFDSFRKPTNEEFKTLQQIVNSIYVDFVNIVSKNRKLEIEFITNNLGALIFDSKKSKEYHLIDDIQNLKNVKNQLANELNFKDFQIIEKEKKRINFFQKITQSSLTLMNNSYENRNRETCSLINNNISVLFIYGNIKNNC